MSGGLGEALGPAVAPAADGDGEAPACPGEADCCGVTLAACSSSAFLICSTDCGSTNVDSARVEGEWTTIRL